MYKNPGTNLNGLFSMEQAYNSQLKTTALLLVVKLWAFSFELSLQLLLTLMMDGTSREFRKSASIYDALTFKFHAG